MSTLKANSYQHVDRASPSITINSDGSVSISSTVTYEDVTSVDSVGIVTARSGLRATAGGIVVTAGVSTFSDDVSFTGAAANTTWDKSANALVFNDHASIQVGTGTDLIIKHDGSHSYIQEGGTGQLKLDASTLEIRNYANSNTMAKFVGDVQVELYHNNTKRLTTTNTGVDITDNLNVVGVATIGSSVYVKGNPAEVRIQHTGNGSYSRLISDSSNNLNIYTGGGPSLAMKIDGSGNVGIGTNSADRMLHILGTGNAIVKMEANYSGSVTGIEGVLTASGANRYVTGIYGKVVNTSGSESNVASIRLWNQQASPTTSDSPGYITFNTTNDGASTATEKLRITSAGKVGIGTITPAHMLHIEGSSPVIQLEDSDNPTGGGNIYSQINGSGSAGRIIISSDPGDNAASSEIRFDVDGGAKMNINSDGQVAINASSGNAPTHYDSATRLSVNGRINSVGSASTASLNTGNGTVVNVGALTNHNLQFIVNNSTKATINTDGNAKFVGIVTATEFVPTVTQTGGFKNLVINGDMRVAQRGTSDTSATQGRTTVDRWSIVWNGAEEVISRYQETLTSSDTGPWEKGLRNAWKIQNGNQTGGADANGYVNPQYNVEAQHLATSGWNYTSSSSYITYSFWAKSSVAQTFYAYLRTLDGTGQAYSFSYALPANTWTKVIKKIPGNSNITINNDNGGGLIIYHSLFLGTDRTNSGNVEETWAAYSSSNRTKDSTTTWYTTNDATYHLTGVQLEVGSQETPFEHISFQEQLRRCQRYYLKYDRWMGASRVSSTTRSFTIPTPIEMRLCEDVTNGTYTNAASSNGDVAYVGATRHTSDISANSLAMSSTSGPSAMQGNVTSSYSAGSSDGGMAAGLYLPGFTIDHDF